MFCPECGSEYREGFLRCSDCDCDLVSQLPSTTELKRDFKLIKVFVSNDPALVTAVKSLLQDAEIEFATRNELTNDAFTYGPTAVEFFVSEDDAAAAESLLLAFQRDDA